ncbi:subtilisin-like protein [Dendrothele bispora CBS 962.96]|uniref:tripeptidyl-peptidase II n=1 Tax=Dendrothele bispora (strain CBS 962.96) TaxID=1314807 RepID=A0A4S8LTT9_DENBC|nr:subtilisin-like protein [Dendrothele bispora CBS 962.96]
MYWSTFVVLALGASSFSKPLQKRWDDLTTKHSWLEVPEGWELQSLPPADQPMLLRLGLKQDKFDELVRNLYEVSEPSHARYGQHLSKEEVDTLVAPHPDTVSAVNDWLMYHGISEPESTTSAGEWVTIRVTVEQAEKMLGAKYGVYRHDKSGDTVLRTVSYSLPKELHSHIDVVAPTTYFGTMKSMKATHFLQPELDVHAKNVSDVEPIANAVPPASCATTITPSCLRTLYNTANYVPKATSTNKLGVAGYLDEFANRADLATFVSRFRTDAAGVTFTTTRVNGGGDDQTDPGVEANLDIQYTIGISFPTPNIYYSTGGSPPFIPDSTTPTNTNEPYLDWLNFIMAQSTIPQTFTTSYGENEQTIPADYMASVCNLFAQLGARGASIMFSSGDSGVGGGNCRTNDGRNVVQFQPAFPASCPFVTTVGGTTRVNPEVAVSFSGGGFSNHFARPSYQNTAVTGFLNALGNTNAGLFNTTGRAYPDVAAQGSGFQVVVGGRVTSVGGTSASSPTVAGVIALVNDFRISNGKAPLGFLNPLIYANPSAFNDIVSGSNPGCGTNGFTARTGWDPVTGLGTPDFLKLQSLLG